MKQKRIKNPSIFLAVFTLIATILSGCGQQKENSIIPSPVPSANVAQPSAEPSSSQGSSDELSSVEATFVAELYVQFGDDGAPFTMYLYDNETAAAIARHVGTADWRIPLYDYEGYDNWEVMQYYDIPNRYEIPSNPETITQAAAGTVYYSDPNRIVLFYKDAQVAGEYTLVGYFDATEELVDAVENNPVLDGWSNKIIKISAEK